MKLRYAVFNLIIEEVQQVIAAIVNNFIAVL